MAEILISSRTWNKPQFKQMCGKPLDEMQCSGSNGVMLPYKPYTVGQTTYNEELILRALRNNNCPQNIHALSSALGEDHIVGVSDSMVKLHDTTSALTGATSTVHAARGDKFVLAVQRYQNTLLAYRNVTQGKGTAGATKASAGVAVSAAFEDMQKHFQRELSMTAGLQRASRKGTPLRNRTRALNIARSSRSIKKLELVSTLQAGKLARFSKYGKALGTGVVAIDFASRIGNVQTTYKADGDWERELFVESSSFAVSAVVGGLVVKAGAAALVFLTVATPVGWVGLIVTAAAVSMGMNSIVKEDAGDTYDSIMSWIGSL